MIVNNFHILRACIRPNKTQTELVVDTNTILTCTFSLKGFKPITRRHTQIVQNYGNFKLTKLTKRHPLKRSKTTNPHT